MATDLASVIDELSIETVIVVDGGVDGLFIGNEYDLGTPSMDAITIISTWKQRKCQKYYAFTAFGTEGPAYKIRHADVLKRVAELVRTDAALGVSALLKGSEEGKRFIEAVDHVHSEVNPIWHSIIASSVVAAMNGSFGEMNLTPRTDWAPVWVSPLTNLYWFFLLDPIAVAKPYLQDVLETDDVPAVAAAIERTRELLGIVEKNDIPI